MRVDGNDGSVPHCWSLSFAAKMVDLRRAALAEGEAVAAALPLFAKHKNKYEDDWMANEKANGGSVYM